MGIRDFVNQYGSLATEIGDRIGVAPNVLLGQWGLETGWGKSVIPGTNNLGNIKSFDGTGTAATDNMTGSRDNYRAYDDPSQFGADFASLLERRYKGAIGAGADAKSYATALKSGGYAEDPSYVDKLVTAANMAKQAGANDDARMTGKGDGFNDYFVDSTQPQARKTRAITSSDGFSNDYFLPDEPVKPVSKAGLMSDTGNLLKSGVNQVAGSLREAVRQIPGVGPSLVSGADAVDKAVTGKTSDEILRADNERIQGALTPEMRGALDKKWWNEETGTLGPAWADPRAYLGGIVQSLPGTALTMIPAGRLAKIAYEAKVGTLGAEAAAASAARTATVAGGLGEGVLAAGQTGADVRDELAKLPQATWDASEAYQALIKSGMAPDDAKNALTNDAATKGFLIAGVTTALFGGQGDRVLARAMTGNIAGGVVKRGLAGAVGEGVLEELPQSYAQEVAKNIGVQTVDPTRSTTEGALNAGLGGLAVGGVQGAGMNMALGRAPTASQVPIDQAADAPITPVVSPDQILALPSPAMPTSDGVMVAGPDGVRPQTYGDVTAREQARLAADRAAAERASLGLGEADRIQRGVAQRSEQMMADAAQEFDQIAAERAFQAEQAAAVPALPPRAVAPGSSGNIAGSLSEAAPVRVSTSVDTSLDTPQPEVSNAAANVPAEPALQPVGRGSSVAGDRPDIGGGSQRVPAGNDARPVPGQPEAPAAARPVGAVPAAQPVEALSAPPVAAPVAQAVTAQDIMSASGVPFKTEKSAQLSIRSRGMTATHTATPVNGGYVLRPIAATTQVAQTRIEPENDIPFDSPGPQDTPMEPVFSRLKSDAEALKAFSENPDLFRNKKSDKTELADIAKDVDTDLEVSERGAIGGEQLYKITRPGYPGEARIWVRKEMPYSGVRAYDQIRNEEGQIVVTNTRLPGENIEAVDLAAPEVYIDVSTMKEGFGGSRIYSIVANYAHNNGMRFIGDPNGLSDEALRRRSENMLSSALKFGTTAHLAPHSRQIAGDAKLGVPPLKWVYGDDVGNVRRLIDVTRKSTENALDETARRERQQALDSQQTAGRSRDGRDNVAPAAPAGVRGKPAVGDRTAQRASIFERASDEARAASGESGPTRDGVLGRGLSVLDQLAADGKKPLLYSRGVDRQSDASGAVREVINAVSSTIDGVTLQSFTDSEAASKHFGVDIPDDARGVYFRGEVALIESNINGRADAEFVLWHELLHAGIMQHAPRYGKEYQRLMNDLKARNAPLAKAATRWREQYGEETVQRSMANGLSREQAEARMQLLSLEEALADLSGRNVQINGLSNFIAKLQQLLRSMGFESLADWMEGKTDAEALQVIAKARQAITSDGVGYINQVPAFSQEDDAAMSKADTIDVDGEQRSRLNSDGKPIHPTDDGIRNFWRWFGDSKVVNADGRPLVMYHGTGADINVFDPTKTKADDVVFTTSDPGYASLFASASTVSNKTNAPNVLPVYVAIQQPSSINETEYSFDSLRNALEGDVDGVLTLDADGQIKTAAAVSATQIKSATGNNGDFSPDRPEIVFSRRVADSGLFSKGQTDQQAEYDAADGAGNLRDTVKDLSGKAMNAARDQRGKFLQVLGRRQILDIYGKDVPELAKYNDLLQRMEADQNDGAQNADAIVQSWRTLTSKRPDVSRSMSEIMHDATRAKYDPDVSQPNSPEQADIRKRWVALPEEAKQLYRQARDTYVEHFNKVKDSLLNRVERSGLDTKAKTRMLEQMRSDFTKAMEGVYFPLARFGDYMVIVKNGKGETQAVSFAETQNQAAELRAQLVRDNPNSTVSQVQKRKEFNAERDGVSKGFMKDLVAVINEEQDGETRESMLDAVNQIYLSSIPDLSWAKTGIHRKGTPGYSQDAMRAFARNMFHGGYYLAKLNYGDQLQSSLMKMQTDIDDKIKTDASYSNVIAQNVVDEMNARHKLVMNPNNTPLANALTGLGFIFHMGLSPASAAVNLSQTALVAYPMMGAKFGFGKAMSALMKASGQAVKGKNDLLSQLSGDEKSAFEQAVKDGVIDLTMAHDLAGVSQGRSGAYNEKTDRVFRVASMMFHEAEKFNRGVTFIANYRLAKEAGQSKETAAKTAADLTYAGHFDYSSNNRARIMQGPTARVVLLFKQYGQNMIYTLARNTVKSLQGDKEAQKTLAGLLAMHGMFAGALGLPLVTTLLAAASAIGGSDDEPWDAQVALRNYMVDVFGKEVGEVLAHGVFRAPGVKDVLGGDISGRVGLDSLLFRAPQDTLQGEKYYEALLTTLAGPVFGIGINIGKGVASASQGDIMRGVEDMMPKAIKDPLKALRYSNEGVVDKSRITLIDDTSVPEEVAQFLGFSPARAMEAYEGKGAIKEAETKLNQRRKELLNRYARARQDGDEADAADVRDMIQRWNRANPGMAITGDTLVKSLQNRAKRQAEAENGVYLPKNKRGLATLGEFAGVE